jgi:hypothetical protein
MNNVADVRYKLGTPSIQLNEVPGVDWGAKRGVDLLARVVIGAETYIEPCTNRTTSRRPRQQFSFEVGEERGLEE